MTKRPRSVGPRQKLIRTTTKGVGVIDPSLVARELGAERVATIVTSGDGSSSPVDMLGLRQQLVGAIRSRGGRPGLAGAEHRPRIPMSSADWNHLESLAQKLATEGFAPTPSQVGSQLLRTALEDLARAPTSGTMRYQIPLLRGGNASEPAARYGPSALSSAADPAGSRSASPDMVAARRTYLEQAQATRPKVRDRRITELAVRGLEGIFSPAGLMLVDKGGPAPTTSIAILGEAGAGKSSLAISLAHSLALCTEGVALYLATEIALTELVHKAKLLGANVGVHAWPQRSDARDGDLVGHHVELVRDRAEAPGPMQRRALEAAWQLVQQDSAIRCVIIDSVPDAADSREALVTLIGALESRGVTPIVVQEGAGGSIPFVADLAFQLRFDSDRRTLRCPKSRYTRALVGPHGLEIDDSISVTRRPDG